MNYQDEQSQIIKEVDQNRHPGREWSKFNGDATCRIILDYIEKHIDLNSMKVAGPNAFIKGFPTEFDLLVVDSRAKPLHLTNAYEVAQVRVAIEVKTSGIFGSNLEDIDNNLKRIFDDFKGPYQNNSSLKLAYLAIREQVGVRENSRNYVQITRETFGRVSSRISNVRTFILSDAKTPPGLFEGEWEQFIEFIKKV